MKHLLLVLFLGATTVTAKSQTVDTVKYSIVKPINYDKTLLLLDKTFSTSKANTLKPILADYVNITLSFNEYDVVDIVDPEFAINILDKILATDVDYQYWIFSNRTSNSARPIFKVRVEGLLLAYSITFTFSSDSKINGIELTK